MESFEPENIAVECCWSRGEILAGECPLINDGEEELLKSAEKRIFEKCCDCDSFKKDLNRFEESGNIFAPLLSSLSKEFVRQKNQVQSLASFLDTQTLQVRFLHELGSVLQSSVDIDEVISVALTAITAGKGFGMNRAFILISDKERQRLRGHLAIGPRYYEEASSTWNEISEKNLDLKSLAQNFRTNKLKSERAKFKDILEQLDIDLADTENILIKTLETKHPILIENAYNNPLVDQKLVSILGVDSFLIMPLLSRNRRIGVIIADNCITRRPISQDDLRSLEMFSFPVAFAIERASLYERLQIELDRVTEANNKLKEQQELIVKMEKMALVGRITSSVAHSIRNPLMIIGGFARSMLKSSSESDQKRTFIESIVKETTQLENVLDEILNYSDSLYPTKDFWDVNNVIESAIRDAQEILLQKNSSCSFNPFIDAPLVYIDIKQLSYCIRSLIMSDCEKGEGEMINIAAKNVDSSVVITIEDKTRKISEDELESLLTPFSVTHNLGDGLGLALCRTMLEKQGIPLLVAAPPEGGVKYTITLPTEKEENYEQTIGG